MTDDELRALHADLVLEDARLSLRYDGKRVPAAVTRYWERHIREIRLVELELRRRGLEPTP